MGAYNVLAAYAMWGAKLPPISFKVLVYMAATSMDSDEFPWFSRGHEHLAARALLRPPPIGEADIRAVERAITPMLRIGAIHVDRKASVRRDGSHTARYRLSLGTRDARRKVSGVDSSEDPQRPTKSDADARRFSDSRPTFCGGTPDEKRRTEEQQEIEEKGGAAAVGAVEPEPAEPQAAAAAPPPIEISPETPKDSDALAADIVQQHTDATGAEAEEVVKAIKAAKQPRSPIGLIRRIAAAGELPTWLADVRKTANPPAGPNLSARSRANDANRARLEAISSSVGTPSFRAEGNRICRVAAQG